MGAVSLVLVLLPGAAAEYGGRHFQQVSREDQEPSPTSVGHVMPTRALGGPALPLMVLPSAVRSPPLRSPDGLLQPVDRRSVRWTPSVGRVSGT